jgi:hypothetical protein
MKARTWLVLVAMMAVAGTGITQQASKEVVCPTGKILIEGKCKLAPDRASAPAAQQGIEPSPPTAVAPPARSHVPVCKDDEVVKDGKCVPRKD